MKISIVNKNARELRWASSFANCFVFFACHSCSQTDAHFSYMYVNILVFFVCAVFSSENYPAAGANIELFTVYIYLAGILSMAFRLTTSIEFKCIGSWARKRLYGAVLLCVDRNWTDSKENDVCSIGCMSESCSDREPNTHTTHKVSAFFCCCLQHVLYYNCDAFTHTRLQYTTTLFGATAVFGRCRWIVSYII